MILFTRYSTRRPTPRLRAWNSAVGTHAGNVTKLADAAISTTYLLVKDGSDDNHVAVCGAGDTPLGVCTDQAEAAEDPINVALLGTASSTRHMVASEAIAVGDTLVPAADGKVRPQPGDSSTYLIVGRALTSASADELVEVDPAPALPSTGTTIGAGAVALSNLAAAIQPSHIAVLGGALTLGGGAASEAETVTGLLATDIVTATITDNASNDDLVLLEAKPSAGTLTLRFNEDPGAGVAVSYVAFRTTS